MYLYTYIRQSEGSLNRLRGVSDPWARWPSGPAAVGGFVVVGGVGRGGPPLNKDIVGKMLNE